MSCSPKIISKKWIQTKYWKEEKTAEEMAILKKVPSYYIQDLIRKYGLQKKKNRIKPKGKRNYVMPECERAKHRVQKHAKEVLVFKGKSKTPIGIFGSINSASKEFNLRREYIRDCLNPNKPRWSTKDYRFEHKKYKGEIIMERRNNLDFTLDLDNITRGLTAALPNYNTEEIMAHYIKKLQLVWEELGYIKQKDNYEK